MSGGAAWASNRFLPDLGFPKSGRYILRSEKSLYVKNGKTYDIKTKSGIYIKLMFTSLDPRFSRDQFHVSTPITKLKALGWACLMSKCSRWDGNMSKSIWEKENMNNNYSITIQKPFNILFNKQLFNITIPPFFNCSFNTKPRFFVTDVQLHGVRFWLPRSWKHGFSQECLPPNIMFYHAWSCFIIHLVLEKCLNF